MEVSRHILRRLAFAVLAMLAAGLLLERPAAADTAAEAVFTDAACDLPGVAPGIFPRLRCGAVSVPRDYGNPGAGRFRLAVVVIRSARQPAAPDPVVYISGGPGSPLTVFADAQALHPIAAGRDIILVDQRGMGRSEPRLCAGTEGDLAGAVAALAIGPDVERRARSRDLFAACRRQATAQGIDLNDFGTAVTVQDFETVRRALGVVRWNVFGVSYGTTVAMTLMARHPESIRSAVLDSVYPPDADLPSWSSQVAKARDGFFDFCAHDAGCAAAYPDLARTYRQTLQFLARTPPDTPLPAAMHLPGDHGALTDALFALVVGHLLYYPHFYPGLPRLIASVHDGDSALFDTALAGLLAEAGDPVTGTNLAAYAAVQCRDRPRYRTAPAAGADVFDRNALYDVCPAWSPPGPPPAIPRDSLIPTLVLAGQFDPNASPPVSRHVAELIGPHAQWIEFLHAGHSVRSSSPCAAGIVAAFFADPGQPAAASCAHQPEAIAIARRRVNRQPE